MKRIKLQIIFSLCSLVFTWGISVNTQAQDALPLNFYLQSLLGNPDLQDEDLHLLLQGDVDKIRSAVERLEGTFKYQFRDYAAVLIPVKQVPKLTKLDFITRIEASHAPGKPLTDLSVINNKVTEVNNGLGPLPDAYKGKGVLLGFIDAGLELLHPDFQDSLGNTRVIELWDQTMGWDLQRTPSYGYGQVWDSAEINAGICPHQDQQIFFGHGTNVTGIGAGNGLAVNNFSGVAPESEIIVVSSKFNALNWPSTVADAVDYIFKVADSLGKPCVINASLGTYLGSHDGRDPYTQMINDLLDEKPGRIMVCAAGNSGEIDPYHLGYNVSADTSFTWFKYNPISGFGFGSVFFEIWSDTGELDGVDFAIGADKVTGGYEFRGHTPFDDISNRLNMVVVDTLWSFSGNELATVQTYADVSEGRYRLQFMLAQPDSNHYNFRLMTTGSGRIDVWSNSWLGISDMVATGLPSIQTFPDIVNYIAPDLEQSIVSYWACSPKIVTVGNYVNRDNYLDVDGVQQVFANSLGERAASSSRGPSREGHTKPDISAPGEITLTAGKFSHLTTLLNNQSLRERVAQGGMHYRAGGTSMSSPGVAGIAALYLEKCPNASYTDFLQSLIANADADNYTGTVPNSDWGNGKANAFKTLVNTNVNTSILSLGNEVCEGDSLALTLDSPFDSYTWNTGDSLSVLLAYQGGFHYADVVNDKGCKGRSDSLFLIINPVPDKPVIAGTPPYKLCEGETLTLSLTEIFGAYEWSNGQFTDQIHVTEAGDYFTEVFNINGCSSFSDTVSVSKFPKPTTPNITQVAAVLFASVIPNVQYQWYIDGVPVSGATTNIFEPLSSGQVTVEVTDNNGCSSASASLGYVTGIDEADTQNFAYHIYPNPTNTGIFQLNWSNMESENFSASVMNILGEEVENRVSSDLASHGTWSFDLSSQPKGIYILYLRSGHTIQTQKIVYP